MGTWKQKGKGKQKEEKERGGCNPPPPLKKYKKMVGLWANQMYSTLAECRSGISNVFIFLCCLWKSHSLTRTTLGQCEEWAKIHYWFLQNWCGHSEEPRGNNALYLGEIFYGQWRESRPTSMHRRIPFQNRWDSKLRVECGRVSQYPSGKALFPTSFPSFSLILSFFENWMCRFQVIIYIFSFKMARYGAFWHARDQIVKNSAQTPCFTFPHEAHATLAAALHGHGSSQIS